MFHDYVEGFNGPVKIIQGTPMITNDAWIQNLIYKPPTEKKMFTEEADFIEEAKILLKNYEEELVSKEEALKRIVNYNTGVFSGIAKVQLEITELNGKIRALKSKFTEEDE